MSMVKSLPNEQWKPLMTSKRGKKRSYMISDHGRIMSYYIGPEEDGRLLQTGLIDGYPAFSYRKGADEDYVEGNVPSRFIHKLVALHFLEPAPTSDHQYVLHLDYDKLNNKVYNLKHATKAEVEEHLKRNPNYIESRRTQKFHPERYSTKLTTTDVIRMKKKIFDPNRKTRLKLIAKQFGISEMQLYRIKSGENWQHVQIPEEEEYWKKKGRN